MAERTCAMVVVGNEILSGKVQDSNAYFAARELRKLGVALNRIAVVPDEIPLIADEVAHCAKTFEFVLTSGGVGPTHDDITIEAVAVAFGRKVVIDPELQRIVSQHFPTVQLENVYILPGIPQIFESKFSALAGRFATDPYFVRAIYLSSGESL